MRFGGGGDFSAEIVGISKRLTVDPPLSHFIKFFTPQSNDIYTRGAFAVLTPCGFLFSCYYGTLLLFPVFFVICQSFTFVSYYLPCLCVPFSFLFSFYQLVYAYMGCKP